MSDDGRTAGFPHPRRAERLPREEQGDGAGAPCAGGRWLTGEAAEELLSGRQLPLADRRDAGEARRLAMLLRAAAAEHAALQPLDPVREEEALAAFRAARVAARVAPPVAVGRAADEGSGEAAADDAAARDTAADDVAAGDALPEPVVVGGHTALPPWSARLVRARRARRVRQGRSTRIALAAAASVVALGGVALGVAATAAGSGGRQPVHPAGSSVPVPAASDGGGATADPGGSGVSGRNALQPEESPDPTAPTPSTPPTAPPASPSSHAGTLPTDGLSFLPPGDTDDEHGDDEGTVNRLDRGRRLGWDKGRSTGH
ncbi:hypothetical protein [Streptomyces sp. CA2R106]|uniref:hypothetical protein n=1 Tax=Streptomyces sp. CA2R106 TaxID=3120153 RepID=UPI00300A1C7E